MQIDIDEKAIHGKNQQDWLDIYGFRMFLHYQSMETVLDFFKILFRDNVVELDTGLPAKFWSDPSRNDYGVR